jgi:hypothetical protein
MPAMLRMQGMALSVKVLFLIIEFVVSPEYAMTPFREYVDEVVVKVLFSRQVPVQLPILNTMATALLFLNVLF